jgi:hypothetical protein
MAPVHVCLCGAFTLGQEGAITVADLATATGAIKFVDLVTAALRTLRVELQPAADAHLRTVATELHGDLVCRLAVHATRWNLPPYARLGRTRARPTKCWHET